MRTGLARKMQAQATPFHNREIPVSIPMYLEPNGSETIVPSLTAKMGTLLE
jgi:hypothetical protein